MAALSTRSQADWPQLELLFAQYLQNDGQAARTLFSGILKVLQGFYRARMDSSQDAEDLAQATLLKIHFARDRYDSAHRLKTWVFTIAHRTLIDHWRESAASTVELLEDSGDEESPLESMASGLLDPSLKTEFHSDINQALRKLKPIERSIVYLYGVEGFSMAEIGESLGITEGAAKLRAHRAYQELRKSLLFWTALLLGLEHPWK